MDGAVDEEADLAQWGFYAYSGGPIAGEGKGVTGFRRAKREQATRENCQTVPDVCGQAQMQEQFVLIALLRQIRRVREELEPPYNRRRQSLNSGGNDRVCL